MTYRRYLLLTKHLKEIGFKLSEQQNYISLWKELTLTLRKRPIVEHLRVWLSLRPWISSRLALNGKISRAQNDLQESQ
jgi:hypothetical protein